MKNIKKGYIYLAKHFILIYSTVALLFYFFAFAYPTTAAPFGKFIKKAFPEIHRLFDVASSDTDIPIGAVLENPSLTTEPTAKVYEDTYSDQDPVISCSSSHPNCPGQSVQAKRSACSNITCCQVGNKWSVYTSLDTCRQAQEAQKQVAYPTCTVFSKTYNLSPEDCRYWQQEEVKINNIGNTDLARPNLNAPTQSSAVDYEAQNQRNIELRAQCYANTSCISEGDVRRQCRALGLGDSSCERRITEARTQCSQARSSCDSRYPVY